MNIINAIKTVHFFQKKEPLIPLTTKWGENLDPHHVLEEYPRPQMKRNHFISLNGYWFYTINKNAAYPKTFEHQILVPFSPEAPLSGVQRQLLPDEYLWYQRDLPCKQHHKRCLLHFGAVDQIADIYINQQHIFHHIGGYLPFSIDITEYLREDINILAVRVQDVSDTSYHSKGKQRLKRGGMYYTAQSGIWQSVWMEWVSETYIKDVKMIPDYDNKLIQVTIELNKKTDQNISLQINDEQTINVYQSKNIDTHLLKINTLKPWTPDSPYLYTLHISTNQDEVECYFAMRIFTIEKDKQNIPRICLNHQPIFMNGVLDQGYWPDGLYTAPSDEALIYDIQMMKSLGFNMIRKHIKIEPARWYYHCDRLGMIVWQDMVNGGSPYHTWFITWMPSLFGKTKKAISDKHHYLLSRTHMTGRKEWINECEQTIEHLSHFPCISTWVLFNEGWGQFDTIELTQYLHKLDPTRFIDSASGWFDQGCGDLRSEHHYFDEPKMIPDSRAFVLSEYGGYACPIKEHMSLSKTYGYGIYENTKDFSNAFKKQMHSTVEPLIEQGLCASVYTQLSDIEEEVNGLLTYDRKVCKLNMK